MLIDGLWHLCDDGIMRPVLRGEVLAADGAWIPVPFLLDTGADRTVFSKDILTALRLKQRGAEERLGGVGGLTKAIVVETQVRLTREGGGKVLFRGSYAAFTSLEALDMSVIGRDLTNLFALIVDRPGDRVCLLGQRHRYVIEQI